MALHDDHPTSRRSAGPVAGPAAEFGHAYPAVAPAPGGEQTFPLTARPTDLRLFGEAATSVWAYNGTVPGPTLRVRLGETLVVPFTNALPQETTIHWHGVRVPNAMDGTLATQNAVRAGETFTYRFAPKDAGTFWYHPHLNSTEQVERGLYGVLVVEDPKPLPYSRDVVWVLDDWRLTRNAQVDPRFDSHHDRMHDGRWGNVITVNGVVEPELVVKAGERLRLRVVDVANGRVFAPDFSAVTANVIAVDGMYAARPLPASGIELAPGNRIDLDVTIDAGQRGQRIAVFDRFARGRGERAPLAWIRVEDESVETPRFESPARATVPEWRDALTRPPDLSYSLSAAGHMGGSRWLINGHAHPDVVADRIPEGSWTKIRFANASGRLHPMHVHGQFFKVLARDGHAIDEPFWRDTVLVHARETIDVGMMALDPGRWMVHCHVLEHAEAGMMTELDVVPAH